MPFLHCRLRLRLISTVLLFVAAMQVSFGADAGEPAPTRLDTYELQNTQWWLLTAETGVGVVLGSVFYFAVDTPSQCRWCIANDFDDWFRTALRASDPVVPARMSDVLAMGLIPAGVIAALMAPAILEKKYDWIWQDFWMTANSAILTIGITEGIKKAFTRQRPAFHYGVQSKTVAADKPGEANLSFYSGHTALAFSIVSSASTIAFLRGYRSAPYLAAAGGVTAAAAGLLRISADMHWCTDVLVGAAVGTAVGVAMPLIFHQRAKKSPVTVTSITPIFGLDVAGVQAAGYF